MRWLTFITALLFTGLIAAQEQRVVDFANWLLHERIAEDTIWLSDVPAMGPILEDTAIIHDSGLFNEADWEHIRAQLKEANAVRWKKGSLSKVHLIRSKRLRAMFHRHDGWKRFHERYALCLPTISVPLFSLDGERCIQWFGVWCDGLNGRGAVEVFELKDGAWRVIESFSRISS